VADGRQNEMRMVESLVYHRSVSYDAGDNRMQPRLDSIEMMRQGQTVTLWLTLSFRLAQTDFSAAKEGYVLLGLSPSEKERQVHDSTIRPETHRQTETTI
jgi:hypothetical protein